MKKTNPSQTIQLQLQKLNKIMEQQHQFNNKHIIAILKTVNKDQNSIFQSASSLSDLDETQINMRTKEGYLVDYQNRESMIKDQVLMYDIENQENTKLQEQQSQDLLLSFIDQQKNTVVIDNRSNYTQSQTETLKWERKNYFRKASNNKNIQNQSQAEIELISNYQESAAPTQTVGISVEKMTQKIKNQIKKDKFRDRDNKLGYFNFSDEVLSKTYIKNVQNNCNVNLQSNSKTYTHTIKPSQAVLLTNSNAQAKKNLNMKNKVNKQKSKIKRPLTNAKLMGLKSEKNCDFPILFTQGANQSAKKIQKTDKQHQKTKQKQLIYLYGDKTAQNRRPKTKRAENVNQTLDNKVIAGGSMMKKKQASYNYDQQALKSSASNASGGKKWLKNNDKSAKKLNKLPVNRIQQSMQSKKQCSITNNKDNKLKFNNHHSRQQNKQQEELRKSDIEKQPKTKIQFPQKASAKTVQKPMHIIQRLNFQNKPKDQDPKLIEQLILIKNLYKSYNIVTNNYRQGVKKINGKYLKLLALEIQNISDHAIYKMKILTAVVIFFSQFFKVSPKNIMGMIAKSQLQSHKQFHIQKNQKGNSEELKNNPHSDYPQKQLIQINNFQVSQDTLILSLLDKPKVLTNIMQTLPFLLSAKSELSNSFVNNLLQSYEQINLQIDRELSLQLFLVKKTKIFNYFHQLVQLIKFLLTNQLVTTVKTLQIEQDNYQNRQQWIGYYSSRSKGQKYDKKNKKQTKNLCHQKQFDSERRVNVEQIFTDRITKLEERNLFVRNNLTNKQIKKTDDYKENIDKKWAMQKQSVLTVSRQKNKNKNKKDAKLG